MPQQEYNRYSLLKNKDGSYDPMPFVEIPVNSSDKYEYWNINFSRMDILSKKYYDNPFYDWLIMLANPSFLSQFDITDDQLIRIPFPLSKALSSYESEILRIKNQ